MLIFVENNFLKNSNVDSNLIIRKIYLNKYLGFILL